MARCGRYDVIVTAPVQKSVINDAGVAFTGHTEYLAARAKAPQVVMMLAGDTAHGPLRVALATTHLPLAEVPRALTVDGLVRVMQLLLHDLKQHFGIAQPRIAVSGLNPHAGEGGLFGARRSRSLRRPSRACAPPATPSTAPCLPTGSSCRRRRASTPCWRCSTTRGCRPAAATFDQA